MSILKTLALGSILVLLTGLASLLSSPHIPVRMSNFQQSTALIGALLLYLSIFFDRLSAVFKQFPIQKLPAKFALISACFAIVHADYSLIFQLGGITGIRLMGIDYLFPLIIGAIAYSIILGFLLMSIPALAIRLPVKNIQLINKLIKPAGFLVLLHAMTIGTHFIERQGTIFYVSLVLILIFVVVAGFSLFKSRKN